MLVLYMDLKHYFRLNPTEQREMYIDAAVLPSIREIPEQKYRFLLWALRYYAKGQFNPLNPEECNNFLKLTNLACSWLDRKNIWTDSSTRQMVQLLWILYYASGDKLYKNTIIKIGNSYTDPIMQTSLLEE